MSGLLTDPQQVFELGGIILAALALLYLLRPRRRQVEVPFGGLWQRVLEQSQAQVLGQNWRRLLSFLLFAAIASLVVAALADPLLRDGLNRPTGATAQRHTVLIMDTSASMAATDGTLHGRNASRLQEASATAQGWLDKAPSDESFLLIAAAGHAVVLAGWGTQRDAIKQILQELKPTQGGLDLHAALGVAEQALKNQADPRIVLLSDGGPALDLAQMATDSVLHGWVGPARLYDPLDVQKKWREPLKMGQQNLAVEDVRIRPDAADNGRGTLSVRVRNDSSQTVAAQLLLAASDKAQLPSEFAEDAALRRVVDVTLPPGVSQQTVAALDLTSARFAVHVRPTHPDFSDVAAYDDWGFAVLPAVGKLGVLLVSSQENMYLRAALLANDRIVPTLIAQKDYKPEDFSANDRGRHHIDLVILDQVSALPPAGQPYLRIQGYDATLDKPAQLKTNPELIVRAGDHPLMRGVSFQDTNFGNVRIAQIEADDAVLAVARPANPVMIARLLPVRSVQWGIDLTDTDLPLRYAMPILLGNAVTWLAGQEDNLVAPLELGRAWAVESPENATDWQYLEPGRQARAARSSAAQLLASSETHGVQVWRAKEGQFIARATVLPASESLAILSPSGKSYSERPARIGPPPDDAAWPLWARWLIAAAAILTVEWLLYLRRRTL